MAIFQTGIILFYISMGAKEGSTIPIIDYYHVYDPIGFQLRKSINPDFNAYGYRCGSSNPGIGLTLARKIYGIYSTFNEDEILEKMKICMINQAPFLVGIPLFTALFSYFIISSNLNHTNRGIGISFATIIAITLFAQVNQFGIQDYVFETGLLLLA